jgi:hypothetical protein
MKPRLDWLCTYGSRSWALVPKATRRKGNFKSVEGILVGYFDDSKAYKVWVPPTQMLIKARDVVFGKLRHVEHTTIHTTNDDNTPSLWVIDGKIPTFIPNPLDDENVIPPLIPLETFEAEIDNTFIQTAGDSKSVETKGGHGKDDGGGGK